MFKVVLAIERFAEIFTYVVGALSLGALIVYVSWSGIVMLLNYIQAPW